MNENIACKPFLVIGIAAIATGELVGVGEPGPDTLAGNIFGKPLRDVVSAEKCTGAYESLAGLIPADGPCGAFGANPAKGLADGEAT